MVVVQEIVLAHGQHVGAYALADLAIELFQRHALPFGGGLDYLGLEGFFKPQSAGKLHGCSRTVAVEVVVDAAVPIHDQRYLHHLKVEFLGQVFLNVLLYRAKGFHSLHGSLERFVVVGQDLGDFFICAHTRAGQICLLIRFIHFFLLV